MQPPTAPLSGTAGQPWSQLDSDSHLRHSDQFVLPLQNKDDDDVDTDEAKAKAEHAVDHVKEKLSHAKHQVVQVVPKPVKDAGHAASDKLGHAKVR